MSSLREFDLQTRLWRFWTTRHIGSEISVFCTQLERSVKRMGSWQIEFRPAVATAVLSRKPVRHGEWNKPFPHKNLGAAIKVSVSMADPQIAVVPGTERPF